MLPACTPNVDRVACATQKTVHACCRLSSSEYKTLRSNCIQFSL